MRIPSAARRRPLARLARIVACVLLAWTALEVLWVRMAMTREAPPPPSAVAPPDRVFITSIHWTDEAVLRSHWAAAVLDLARTLGPERVFVSIGESGSLDNTKDALRGLDEALGRAGIGRRVALDDTPRADVVAAAPALPAEGWTVMPVDKTVPASPSTWSTIPRGQPVPRRIPYLAGLRNAALEPLYELQRAGRTFDKILFLNDVVFTTQDVLTLLATRGGDYAAACALDFKRPPAPYDTFALRDADGHEPLSSAWPYFRARASRAALKAGRPVPVTSCWNGMLAMDAAPFYADAATTPPRLAFRGIPDSLAAQHLEASECCLIHTDNPLSRRAGVWLNPRVRVGYNGSAYDAVHPVSSSSSSSASASADVPWLSPATLALGLWRNRLARWSSTPWLRDRVVAARLAAWRRLAPAAGRSESGHPCLIDETQILIFNGWAHI